MMLATEMGPAVARSSLERMLDTIRLREERPEGAPPALPARPVSRGRLPSSRRRPLLPIQLKVGSGVPELQNKGFGRRDETKVVVFERGFVKQGSPDHEMMGLESYDERSENDPATTLDAEVGSGNARIALVEDARNNTLQGILWVQKRFRGHQARSSIQELKRGATTLQSFIRGERTRCGFEYIAKRAKAAVLIQKHVKRWITRKRIDEQRKDVILLQSGIRSWLARRRLMVLKTLELPKPKVIRVNKYLHEYLQEMKDAEREQLQVHPSASEELERRVLQAEVALRNKEEENVLLRQQLKQYEIRWSENEARMKSMEQNWQKQLTSLQMSLAAAKKSLIADSSSDHLSFDSEDTMSAATKTPEGTPAKQSRPSDATLSRNPDGPRNAVSELVREFEQRRQVFENNVGSLAKVKSGKSDSMMNPNIEVRKLKDRFEAWRKDYKIRLHETKAELQKLEPKPRKRWWTLSCSR